jgi:hypothetical protein
MIRKLLLFQVLVLFVFPVYSKEVSKDIARRVALNFFAERVSQAYPADPYVPGISAWSAVPSEAAPLYYIFNFTPRGFILISADDAAVPVLGYSFEGTYSTENPPEACRAWVKQYEDGIRYARENSSEPFPSTRALWVRYSEAGYRMQASGLRGFVAPLITSNWNQDAPYNEQCPADPAGPGGHAYAGCVPTCMGQLMYYYRWPDTGTGSYSYYDSTYGTLSARFDTTHYDWSGMADIATGSNPEIARLLFHLGVSCDLVYGPGGSGMYNHKAAYSLRTFFKYSPQTQYVFRDSTGMNWDSILVAHLDRNMPMYYAGWSVPNINGHAFVCDGYQDTAYFHFNFGWSGQNNGYYFTGNLTPGGNNFNLAQEVIINSFPDTVNYTYPGYCTGAHILKYRHGSLEDGSGPMYGYRPATSCSWLIDPQDDFDSVSSITLTFVKFETNPGDLVKVYDGGDISAPLLGQFDGNTLPPGLTSTGNRMLVTFTSGSGSQAPGFYATYDAETPVWCTGTTTITADTAEISDGSYRFNYHNLQNCKWKLMPENGQPLTVYFHSFDTEPDKDILKIYDLSNSTLLATLSGHYESGSLPDSVTCESGQMYVIFTTNGSVTSNGWELYYPKSTLGIGDPASARNLRVFPVPASGSLQITFTSAERNPALLSLCNMQGAEVLHTALKVSQGFNSIALPLGGIAPGVYALSITVGETIITRKVIIQ